MSIFEELMLQNRQLTESFVGKSQVRKTEKTPTKKISTKNIKVESMRIFEEEDFDELDKQFAVDPDEAEAKDSEFVLIVDKDLPEDEEVPEDAAANIVGLDIYKCPVCGSNYAVRPDCMECNDEGVPTECPVCGDEAEQVLAGIVAPADEAKGEELDEQEPIDAEDAEDRETASPEADEEAASKVPEEVEDEIAEEDELIEDSLDASKYYSMTESACKDKDCKKGKKSKNKDKDLEEECSDKKADAKKSTKKTKKEGVEVNVTPEGQVNVDVDSDEGEEEIDAVQAPAAEVEATEDDTLYFDNDKLESLMNRVIRENYEGTPKFKVRKVSYKGSRITLEYLVRESAHTFTKGTLVAEGFEPERRIITLNAKDCGAFTESFTKKPSFQIECRRVGHNIVPVSVEYNFTKKVNESVYRVYGSTKRKHSRLHEELGMNPSVEAILDADYDYWQAKSAPGQDDSISHYIDSGAASRDLQDPDFGYEWVFRNIKSALRQWVTDRSKVDQYAQKVMDFIADDFSGDTID